MGGISRRDSSEAERIEAELSGAKRSRDKWSGAEWGEAERLEAERSGVSNTALCPGWTRSGAKRSRVYIIVKNSKKSGVHTNTMKSIGK